MRLVFITLDAVFQHDADRLNSLPALRALKEGGVFCKNVQTVYPTLTYPIHTTLLTGCYPDTHGIGHNQPFQPDTAPEMRAWYWDARDIQVPTLHTAAKAKGLDVASVLWPVSGKNKALRRNFPEVLPLPGESAVMKMLRYASPVWLLQTELTCGKQRKSIRQPDLDDYATVLCEQLIASQKVPDLLTVHLVDCDSMRHDYGVDSKEAQDAMTRLDGRVQRILNALQKRGMLDDTLIAIASDHGQAETPEAVRLDKLLQAACGARAQSLGMGAYIFGDDLAAAESCLRAHAEDWCIAHIYTAGELRALHAPPHVHLAVEAQPGTCFTDKVEGHLGDHGFAVTHPGAKTLLWLYGAAFKKGIALDACHITDIAPTLAYAMGLQLPSAQGKILRETLQNTKD